MLLPTILLAGLVSAAPALNTRQATNDFLPWDITAASAFSPSGRPGSSPESTVTISIKQPNVIRLQQAPTGYAGFLPFEATCRWSWTGGRTNFPAGAEALCSSEAGASTYGNFTMTLSGTDQANFSVAIKETREVTIFQQKYVRVYEGEREFTLTGDWRQSCGGSGVCSWSPLEGVLPIKVQQELTESIGSCEEATIGGC
ncbi:hypothetical protein OPT61_g4474 [Boeremia exigua]|uniref:Uncharacterized protein n=1 Tax=Boeremia exigua TaxID=749465 RepID=A0ACC2IDW2_9PLEO|nr:hypothetical protein OPT61_g4474 [Boeremia exigua]